MVPNTDAILRKPRVKNDAANVAENVATNTTTVNRLTYCQKTELYHNTIFSKRHRVAGIQSVFFLYTFYLDATLRTTKIRNFDAYTIRKPSLAPGAGVLRLKRMVYSSSARSN